MRRISSFKEMIEVVQESSQPKKTLAVIAPEEPKIISAVVQAIKEKIVKDAIFVGKTEVAQQIVSRRALSLSGVTMIDEPDKLCAVQKAIGLIISGEAQMLMKGAISSNLVQSGILKDSILKKRRGKKTRASHIVVVEREERLELWSDCGLNPTGRGKRIEGGWFISEKKEVEILKEIAKNAIEVAHLLGIEKPRVAFISESNRTNLASSTSAIPKRLAEMEWPGAIADFMDIDSARSWVARKMKRLSCLFDGEADVIIFPTLIAANMIKIGLFEWVWGGFLYRAGVPCAFPSEADDEQSKYLSIVLAAYFDMMEERK